MTGIRRAFAANAETLIGSKFRLGGRDPQYGIDCVGLVACALERAGHEIPEIPQYRLRNSDYAFVGPLWSKAGFQRVSEWPQRGDLIVVQPGPAQRHVMVALGADRFVHAHASLGQVVTCHGPIPWRILAILRLKESN